MEGTEKKDNIPPTTLTSQQSNNMKSDTVETRIPSNPVAQLNPTTAFSRKGGRRFSHIESSATPSVADDVAGTGSMKRVDVTCGVNASVVKSPSPPSGGRPDAMKCHAAAVISDAALVHTELEIDDPVQVRTLQG